MQHFNICFSVLAVREQLDNVKLVLGSEKSNINFVAAPLRKILSKQCKQK